MLETDNEIEIEETLKNALYELKQVDDVDKLKSALIIAGEALTRMETCPNLMKLLVEVTDRINVVIACRVSPS